MELLLILDTVLLLWKKKCVTRTPMCSNFLVICVAIGAAIKHTSVQLINQYPPSVFKNTNQWINIEYFSTHCSFIHQYYNINYPNINIKNITCNQSLQPYFKSIEEYQLNDSIVSLNPFLMEL